MYENEIKDTENRCRIYWIDGKKFKTQICTVTFALVRSEETITKTALLVNVLKEGCQKYNSPRKMARATESMYGAIYDVQTVQKGYEQFLTFTIETIKQVPVEEMVDFLKECMIYPQANAVEFSVDIVDKQKKILERQIKQRKDDVRMYAGDRAIESLAKGTTLSLPLCGDIEKIPEITAKSLYQYYREILENQKVKIFFCGNESGKFIVAGLRKEFRGVVPASSVESMCNSSSYTVDKPEIVVDTMEITQARVLYGFIGTHVYGTKNYMALLVFLQILGRGAKSLLFQKIREEQGLCYDIKALHVPLTPYVFVETGIHPNNKKSVGLEVIKSVESLIVTPPTKEVLAQAKEEVARNYTGIVDSPFAMMNFIFDEKLYEKRGGLARCLRDLRSVRPRDVQKVASSLSFALLYSLQKKGGGTNESHT
ncbi:MAG: insulinase family protein [Bacillota bacterium]